MVEIYAHCSQIALIGPHGRALASAGALSIVEIGTSNGVLCGRQLSIMPPAMVRAFKLRHVFIRRINFGIIASVSSSPIRYRRRGANFASS